MPRFSRAFDQSSHRMTPRLRSRLYEPFVRPAGLSHREQLVERDAARLPFDEVEKRCAVLTVGERVEPGDRGLE